MRERLQVARRRRNEKVASGRVGWEGMRFRRGDSDDWNREELAAREVGDGAIVWGFS